MMVFMQSKYSKCDRAGREAYRELVTDFSALVRIVFMGLVACLCTGSWDVLAADPHIHSVLGYVQDGEKGPETRSKTTFRDAVEILTESRRAGKSKVSVRLAEGVRYEELDNDGDGVFESIAVMKGGEAYEMFRRSPFGGVTPVENARRGRCETKRQAFDLDKDGVKEFRVTETFRAGKPILMVIRHRKGSSVSFIGPGAIGYMESDDDGDGHFEAMTVVDQRLLPVEMFTRDRGGRITPEDTDTLHDIVRKNRLAMDVFSGIVEVAKNGKPEEKKALLDLFEAMKKMCDESGHDHSANHR